MPPLQQYLIREERMKLDGKNLAARIYESLGQRVRKLQRKGITPHLAVLLVGNDPASEAYVHQKKKRGEQLGCIVDVIGLTESTSERELVVRLGQLSRDPKVHGIIVQRPLPKHINEQVVDEAVVPDKDVDGFHPESPFREPIALAVDGVLKEALKKIAEQPHHPDQISLNITDYANIDHYILSEYKAWVQQKKVVVIGKGKTGGQPIIEYFQTLNVAPEIIDSRTPDPKEILRNADIIVTTVGKSHILKPDMIKKGVILIAIGMHKGEDGKLHADFDEEEMEGTAGFYTPVPGGVGPVNVAMLLSNLTDAAENSGN